MNTARGPKPPPKPPRKLTVPERDELIALINTEP